MPFELSPVTPICQWNRCPMIVFIRNYYQPLKRQSRLQQTTNFATSFPIFEKKRNDISWESSANRGFSWNIMPYLLFLKKRQNLKLSSAEIIGGALRVKLHTTWTVSIDNIRVIEWTSMFCVGKNISHKKRKRNLWWENPIYHVLVAHNAYLETFKRGNKLPYLYK